MSCSGSRASMSSTTRRNQTTNTASGYGAQDPCRSRKITATAQLIAQLRHELFIKKTFSI